MARPRLSGMLAAYDQKSKCRNPGDDEEQPAARSPAGDGHVRARGRHVADERVDLHLSWRLGFLFEVAVIAVVLSGIKLVRDVPYTGSRRVDVVGALLSVLARGHRAGHPDLAGRR